MSAGSVAGESQDPDSQSNQGPEMEQDPLPPQVPISAAANAPARASRPTRRRRFVDIAIIVVAPIYTSILILATTRVHGGDNVLFKLSIGEVAIAISAVATTSITRAWISRSEPWEVVLVLAAIIGLGQGFFVPAFDNFNSVAALVNTASKCNEKCDLAKVAELANSIISNNPSWFPWMLCVGSGVILVVAVSYTIWRES